jgi:hypothetical protein
MTNETHRRIPESVEQSFAAAEHDRMHHQAVVVDEAVPGQVRYQLAASVHQQVAPGALP